MKKKYGYIIIILALLIAIVLVSYQVVLNNRRNNIVFLLFGENEDNIYLRGNYHDMGYYAKLKDGEDLSDYVTVLNSLNTNQLGKYEIKYILSYKGVKKELIRYVNVIKDPVTDISLGLNGDSVVYLLKGMEYVEQGITAIDILDGDISASLQTTNYIDSQYTGEYLVRYEVTNSRNVTKTIERKVIIYDYQYDLDVSYNQEGNLQLNFVTSSDIFKEIMINQEKVSGKTINLILSDNQEYTVSVIDIYGNIKSNFYDFLKPSLSCTATIELSGTTFNVVASDNAGIKEYNYFVDNVQHTSLENIYKTSVISTTASVSVSDQNNNVTKKACTIVDNVPYFDSGLKNSQYSNWLYYLYVPENVKQYTKMPLVVFLHGTGERGSNLNLLTRYGFIKYINAGQKYNSFILVPQLNRGANWRDDFSKVINLIETVKSAYNIDADQIHIVGFSLGAIDIIEGVQTYNNYFASTVLIAPSGHGAKYAKAFKNIPTQVHNGELDTASHTSGTQEFVLELTKIGGNVSYTRYPGYYHNVVDRVLEDGTVFNWMLTHKRNS